MRSKFSYKNALLYEIFEHKIIPEIFNNASKKFGKVCHTDFLQKSKKDRKKLAMILKFCYNCLDH